MYRLYIDETGNADLKASRDPNHRYLSLTGVVIHLDHVREAATPRLEALKQRIFKPDPDEPIVLHRKDLMNKNRPFQALRDPFVEADFNQGLLELFAGLTFRVLTVVIDKFAHLNRYHVWHYEPYHYCLEVLLERYALMLQAIDASGDVMAEVRGKTADRRLKKCYARLYENGGSFIGSETFRLRLTSKHLKMKAKDRNVAGLQIADLLAHPSALYLRHRHANGQEPTGFGVELIRMLVQSKYHRVGNRIEGRGTKWLP